MIQPAQFVELEDFFRRARVGAFSQVDDKRRIGSGGFPAAGFEGWKGLTDEELIASHREGWGPSREEAVEELFHRHQNRIVRWCYRFTRDRESGLDLAQEIFMRAFRNLDRYRGECRFSTWLYVIAVRSDQFFIRQPFPSLEPGCGESSAPLHRRNHSFQVLIEAC